MVDIIEILFLLMMMGVFIRGMIQCNEFVVVMILVYYFFVRIICENYCVVIECDLLCDENNYYIIDFEKLEDICLCLENKILIFCNFYNLVGCCWIEEEVRKVVVIVQKIGIILIFDEIYVDFVYDEKCYMLVMKVVENLNGIIVFLFGGKLFNIGGIFSFYVFMVDFVFKKQMVVVLKELYFQFIVFVYEVVYVGYKYCYDYCEEVVNYICKMQIKLVNGFNNMLYLVKVNLLEVIYFVWVDFNDMGWLGDCIQEFLVQDVGFGFNWGDQFGVVGIGFV